MSLGRRSWSMAAPAISKSLRCPSASGRRVGNLSGQLTRLALLLAGAPAPSSPPCSSCCVPPTHRWRRRCATPTRTPRRLTPTARSNGGLLAALNGWDRALCRDDCGDWCISGSRGSVHARGGCKAWVLCARSRSTRHWSATKARFSFCHLTQMVSTRDALKLLNLPTPKQAAAHPRCLGHPETDRNATRMRWRIGDPRLKRLVQPDIGSGGFLST